jgi:hypothetical protein
MCLAEVASLRITFARCELRATEVLSGEVEEEEEMGLEERSF